VGSARGHVQVARIDPRNECDPNGRWDVIGSKELVGGPLTPTEEAPFVVAEKHLACQDGVL
jgi:hypothetical protein